MPRINRVRLINYAWANRRIDDLTLDFHGGMNAEIRLGNGGGKSVLQRLIFQAVNPNTTVSNNRIEDYLKAKPAMTIIEWVLDTDRREREPKLLTTGVLLSKSDAGADSNSSVHYFTFVSNDSKHLSLEHLPNVESGAGAVEIESYKISADKYRNLSYNYPEIFYYPSQDKRNYHAKLEEFGISVSNWNEIIKKMISSEDPFTVFLRDSKTTDQLINNYLLPNIETHISRSGDNRSHIMNQLSANIEAMAAQKEKKDLRDHLVSYLEEEAGLDGLLEEVIHQKQLQTETVSILLGFQTAVRQRIQELEEAAVQLNEAKQQAEQEGDRINREEASYQWYQAGEAKEQANEILRAVEEELARQKDAIHHLEWKINLLETRQIYDDLNQFKGEKQALEEKKKGLEASEEILQLNRLSAILFARYETEANMASARIEEQNQIRTNTEQELAKTKQSLQDLRRKLDQINQRIGTLQAEKKQAEEKEKALFHELDLDVLRRDLMGCYISEEVSAAKRILSSRIDASLAELDRLSKLISSLGQEIHNSQDARTQAIQKQTETELECRVQEEQLRQYVQDRDSLTIHLERYGIASEHLFDKDYLKEECARRRRENEESADQIKYRKQVRQELLVSARNGNVYIPDSVTAMLERYGIAFETGENYLSSLGKRDRKRYLSLNPLLPFALLVDPANLEKLEALDLREELIRQVIPVFLYGEIDQERASMNAFLYQIKEELLEEKQREEYLRAVERMIEADNDALNRFADERRNLDAFQSAIDRFGYDAGFEEERKDSIEILRETGRKLLEQRNKLDQKIQEQEKERRQSEKQLNERTYQKEQEIRQNERFINYLEVDEPACQKLVHELSERKTEKSKAEKVLADLDLRIAENEKTLRSCETILQEAEHLLNEARRKQARYSAGSERVESEEETSALEARYDILSRKTNEDAQKLLQDIETLSQKIQLKSEEFDARMIPVEELQEIRWSLAEHKRLKQESTALAAQEEELQKRAGSAQKDAGNADAVFAQAVRTLQETGLEEPLEKEQIRMHFKERRAELGYRIQEIIGHLNQTMEDSGRNRNVLGHLELMRLEGEPAGDVMLEENAQEQFQLLKGRYNEESIALKEGRKAYLDAYRKLRSRYADKHTLFQKLFQNGCVLETNDDCSLRELELWKETTAAGRNTLQKNLDMYNTELEKLDIGVRQMIHSIITYTRRLTEALRQISKQSTMQLKDRSSPVRLLRIDLHDDLTDSSDRLDAYIREGIRRLADLSQEKSGDLEKEMNQLLNSRRLISVYLEQTNIPVKVYRFDENSSHSALVEWDKATRSNSTGEHSTSCFVIIAAMMAYTRGSDPELADARIERYEPIICDNPFAAISSEYLVRPLITIVDKLHLQLISFTHNTQQSIANSFDVVIQLRNTALRSGTNRIGVETERVSEEKMEHAELFSSGKQLSMF